MKEDPKQGKKGEIIHTLIESFDYAHKGGMREAEFITLKSPTISNLSSVARLKQGFMKAVTANNQTVKESKKSQEASLDDLTGEAIMTMLSMSDIDYAGYLETAKFVFTHSDISLIDGEIKFTKDLANRLSYDDLEAMTGEYLKNFILTSVLKSMQM